MSTWERRRLAGSDARPAERLHSHNGVYDPCNPMSMSRGARRLGGILNVDKPLDWTSHDVVGLVRRLSGERQVGHAGTLDPLATGVLLVMVGAATRLSDALMHSRKCYHARLRLGVRTSTDDGEGEILEARSTEGVARERVLEVLRGFRGCIAQVPPAYAAIKQGGVPAYKLARRGQAPTLAAREVRIDALALTGMDREAQTLDLLVWCGAGTYIRALARDVGTELGCGAHLAALRRLSSGAFGVDSAIGMPELRELAGQGRLHERLRPLGDAVAGWPVLVLSNEEARAVLHGMPVKGPAASDVEDACLYARDGRLLALARYQAQRGVWQPTKVLATGGDNDEER